MHGTKKESGTKDSFSASVSLRCAYTDRIALMDDLLTNQRTWPYFTAAKARTASAQPLSARYTTSGQSCEYEDAIVTVNYNTDPDADLITESIEPTAEFRLLDHRNFRWSSATGQLLNENESPGQLIRGIKLVRTMYNLVTIPVSLLTLPGTCNLGSYTSTLLGLTFAAETLLFGIQPITRTIKLSGVGTYTVTINMSYKEATWNKFWNQKTKTYENIYEFNGAIYKPYTPTSFSDFLF
jgi:hypothetical protein